MRSVPPALAGGSIKPGVKRSGTPGSGERMIQSARSVRQRQPQDLLSAVARFAGLTSDGLDPGVPLRFTPGFMLAPPSRAPTNA